ncbi:MAG: FAD-binding oxidoreductase [Gemmatimonadales bacterium]
MKEVPYTTLQTLLGPGSVERDPRGLARAVPEDEAALALVCRTAHEEGWKIRLEGRATWLPADAPADLALSTRGLDGVVSVSPADLVATVRAGTPLEALRRQLADHGMWLALDPPGRPDRSIGSVVATATSGPLRQAYGPVRDQVLGCTVVTGDGRRVKAGGRVVKNVAGYDLTKLQVGGFGGFGVISELHLRLRALPRADMTLIARDGRDVLTGAARAAAAAQIGCSTLELLSPALAADSEWVLAARFTGNEVTVQSEGRRLQGETALTWQQLPVERSGAFWSMAARAALGGVITVRLGALTDGLDESIDLLIDTLDEGLISAGAGAGAIRWSGSAEPDRLRHLRRQAAGREIPMTIERAPWALRRLLGHFGAYREGVGQLVGRLRESFDPSQCLSVALEGSEE